MPKSGYIRFKLALPWAASAALGAVGGASLALKTDEKLIRSLMVVVLPVVAFYVLKNKELGGGETPLPRIRTDSAVCFLQAWLSPF